MNAALARCATCGIEQCRHFDGWDGAALGCEETSRRWGGHYEAPAPEPVPTFREYTFAVYVTVPEPVNDDDVDGYTRADVVALIKRTLASYTAPSKGRPAVDWELMDSAPVSERVRAER